MEKEIIFDVVGSGVSKSHIALLLHKPVCGNKSPHIGWTGATYKVTNSKFIPQFEPGIILEKIEEIISCKHCLTWYNTNKPNQHGK